MILTCPSCAAQFAIKPELLGATGRTVRCVKCKHTWHATPPLITLPDAPGEAGAGAATAPGGLASVKVPDAKVDAADAVKIKRKRQIAVIAGVLVAVLLTVPVLLGTLKKLQAGGVAAPVLADGIPAKKGIVLDGTPTTKLFQEAGRNMLKIEGQLANTADDVRKVPKLRAQGLNARGQIVREWDIPLHADQLEPGRRLPFTFDTPFAEQGVVDIAFHFI